MDAGEAIEYLYGLDRYNVKVGFRRAERLLDEVGRPHEDLDCIQVAGSNGKGSVARVLESSLRQAGRRVGLYTSPHLHDLGERVRVDGRKTTRREIADFVSRVQPAVEALRERDDEPTFFEVTTAMALDVFARHGVDVAVLEVGLGGRYDTTSVCDADAAVVTNVALEHTEQLGDSVREIARDLAHVVPESGFVATAAEGDALDVVRDVARERDADLRVVEDGYEVGSADLAEQSFETEYDGVDTEFTTPLLGDHGARNTVTALKLLESLDVDVEAAREGVRRATWPGRFEAVGRDPVVVLDAAHNPAGARALAETYDDVVGRPASLVFGALGDKDVEAMAEALSPVAEAAYVAEPGRPRAAAVGRTADAFERQGVETTRHDGVLTALESALRSGNPVLVTGSLYTVGEARRRWRRTSTAARHRSVEDVAGDLAGFDVEPGSLVHHAARLRNLTPPEAERLRDSGVDGVRMGGDHVDVSVAGHRGRHADVAAAVGIPYPDLDVELRAPGDTAVMGVLNVTPDSFYDGGLYHDYDAAVERGFEMADEGADVVDVGGESTRPGAEAVDVDEEARRVVPVVESLVEGGVDAEVSVDTRNPGTARRALDAGATWINDVSGLDDPRMRGLVAERGCRVVVMDSVDVPVDPSADYAYDDVVDDVVDRLMEAVLRARRAGVEDEQVVLDPGIGFGKGPEGDAALLRRTREIASLGYPLLMGCSRKSFLSKALDVSGDRLQASVAAHLYAALEGASYVRVHDVRETREALSMASNLLG
ncbi:MAG: dihydropteroate synthase [Halobacteriales archaeon]